MAVPGLETSLEEGIGELPLFLSFTHHQGAAPTTRIATTTLTII